MTLSTSIRPPSKIIKFILASFTGQFLVPNWPRNMENAVKMIWGRSRCHVLGVKGHRRSNFKIQYFQILIADLDSLQKKYDSKECFFFLLFNQNTEIWEFGFLKFYLRPFTFDPQDMASDLIMTSDCFDSIFHVRWSIWNQKLPGKWS